MTFSTNPLSMKTAKNRVFQIILMVLSISLITTIECRADNNQEVKTEFDKLYIDWGKETQEIRYSSRTEDYINLPAFRKIVALGRKALPFLKEKLLKNENDFMLAHAVVEIMGWKIEDFGNYFSEQELRNRVVKRMEQIK